MIFVGNDDAGGVGEQRAALTVDSADKVMLKAAKNTNRTLRTVQQMISEMEEGQEEPYGVCDSSGK